MNVSWTAVKEKCMSALYWMHCRTTREYNGQWWLQWLKSILQAAADDTHTGPHWWHRGWIWTRYRASHPWSSGSRKWACSRTKLHPETTHTHTHTESLAAPNLSITTSNPLVFQQHGSALWQTFQQVKNKLRVATLLLRSTCSNFQDLTFLIHKVYLRACSEHWRVTHWFKLLQPLVQVKRSQKWLI